MKTQDGELNHSHNHYSPTHNAIKPGRNAFSVWEDFILKRATLIMENHCLLFALHSFFKDVNVYGKQRVKK